MKRTIQLLGALLALGACGAAFAAGADLGTTAKQATNWIAIGMFGVFVAGTLWITKWAASKTKSAADFYTGRLHVGCVLLGHFRCGHGLGL
jgi:cation/acetate symporter